MAGSSLLRGLSGQLGRDRCDIVDCQLLFHEVKACIRELALGAACRVQRLEIVHRSRNILVAGNAALARIVDHDGDRDVLSLVALRLIHREAAPHVHLGASRHSRRIGATLRTCQAGEVFTGSGRIRCSSTKRGWLVKYADSAQCVAVGPWQRSETGWMLKGGDDLRENAAEHECAAAAAGEYCCDGASDVGE